MAIDSLTHFDLAVIGAGTVGMACAMAMAMRGYRVAVLDHKPKPTTDRFAERLARRDARVYALNLASIQLFDQLGVWQNIMRKADYTRMSVWAQDGRGMMDFVQPPSADDRLGSMVEPVVLDHALWCQACSADFADKLTMIYDATLLEHGMAIDQTASQVMVRYRQGGNARVLSADLVIGADGRTSAVRQALGIGVEHQKAICCAIRTTKAHQQTARQVMLPTGTLALLPMANLNESDNEKWQSVVWTLPENLAEEYLSLSADVLMEKIAFACGYELGEVLQIESIASFPLSAQIAQKYAMGRVALIGDAAHGVHPLAGQGLNLGLLDVMALMDIVDQYRGKNTSLRPNLLTQYARVRKGHNALMMHSFSLINFAFASSLADIGAFGWLRSEGMSFIANHQRIMQQLIHRANAKVAA